LRNNPSIAAAAADEGIRWPKTSSVIDAFACPIRREIDKISILTAINMLTCVCLSAWNFTRGENPPHVLDELKAWATAFTFSWDFFGDLKRYGLADDKAVRRAAKAAWKRLGARFMAAWKPTPARKTPWTLDRFGAP
jgi:hypothetical protein